MSRLFGFMCNDPERVACALHPVRDALIVEGVPDGWGLAFFQGGEVLLQRHPKPVGTLDIYQQVKDVKTDYLVGAVREPGTPAKLENTQPYRFRSWVYAQSGKIFPSKDGALLQQIPDFLRRNVRGQNDSEQFFHMFLSFLHDGGKLDDPNLRVAEAAAALRATFALTEKLLGDGQKLAVNGVATNGRITVALVNGAPVWARQTSGIPDCRVCRDQHQETARGGERRRTAHEHVRAILVASDPPKAALKSDDGWEEIPSGSIIGISRDLGKSLLPLRPE